MAFLYRQRLFAYAIITLEKFVEDINLTIKIKKAKLEDIIAKKKNKKFIPKKPGMLFRILVKILSSKDLKATNFKLEKVGMEKLGKKEPCLILMNHASFIDLKIAQSILFPRPVNIVTSMDAFVGLKWLLRQIGCFPTRKFVPDISLVHNMVHCVNKLKSSVLMFPEAGYSFDGTATTLPESLGKCVKLLNVPLVTIISNGAFARQPLYNNLIKRKIDVSAKMEYLLSKEQIQKMSAEEINKVIINAFTFDAFKWQKDNGIKITEPNRADGLERLLYKCPHCLKEGNLVGKGITLTCQDCGKEYILKEDGQMQAKDGETEFAHIPDWYVWERKCAREEVVNGSYLLQDDVDIYIVKEYQALYDVGQGKLVQNNDGISLYKQDGELIYNQPPLYSHSILSDFFWYELGDVICIGNNDITYCCIPKNLKNVVTKARLVAEELYKIKKEQK